MSGLAEGILLGEAAWSYFDTLQKTQLPFDELRAALSTSDTLLRKSGYAAPFDMLRYSGRRSTSAIILDQR